MDMWMNKSSNVPWSVSLFYPEHRRTVIKKGLWGTHHVSRPGVQPLGGPSVFFHWVMLFWELPLLLFNVIWTRSSGGWRESVFFRSPWHPPSWLPWRPSIGTNSCTTVSGVRKMISEDWVQVPALSHASCEWSGKLTSLSLLLPL